MRIYPRPNWPFKVIEEQAVTQAIVAARNTWARFDEIWDGIVWLIARGLEGEKRLFGGVEHNIYTYAGDPVAGFPRIVVVYRWGVEAYVLRVLLVSDPVD